MNKVTQELQAKVNKYQDLELINRELGQENNELKDHINASRNLDEVIRSKEDLIEITKEQLKAEQERNKIIENNLTIALNNNNNNNFFQNPQTLGDVTNPIRNTNDVTEDRPITPNVVLFHDSLCKHK